MGLQIFALLKMLFFGGSTVLTPEPIDIEVNQPVLIEFKTTINAINSGASIYIDVTQQISSSNVIDGLNEINDRFPPGCVTAKLNSTSDISVLLNNSSGSWGSENRSIRLSSSEIMRTDVIFSSVEIISCIKIHQTVVTWKNFSK